MIRSWSKWSKFQDEYLKQTYGRISTKLIAKKLKRGIPAVRTRASQLSLKHDNPSLYKNIFKEDEIKFLKDNYHHLSMTQLCKKLKRTKGCLTCKAQRIGLKRFAIQEQSLTETEKAYLAGFIDGEGTLTIQINWKSPRKTISPYFIICNTNKETIDFVKEKFQFDNFFNKVTNKKRGFNQPIYTYRTSSRSRVKTIIENIFPYLIAKKEQARLLLKLFKIIPKRRTWKRHPTKEEFQIGLKIISLNSKTKSSKKYTDRIKNLMTNIKF